MGYNLTMIESDRAILRGYKSLVVAGLDSGGTERTKEVLEAIRVNQLNRLIAIGLHEQVGLSESEYRDGFPPFQQPQEFEGTFDFPVLVDPRVKLTALQRSMGLEHASVSNWHILRSDLDSNVQDIEETPEYPYAIWASYPHRHREHEIQAPFAPRLNAKTVQKYFRDDEVGMTLREGIYFGNNYPEFFGLVVALGSKYQESRFIGFDGGKIVALGKRGANPYKPGLVNLGFLTRGR